MDSGIVGRDLIENCRLYEYSTQAVVLDSGSLVTAGPSECFNVLETSIVATHENWKQENDNLIREYEA